MTTIFVRFGRARLLPLWTPVFLSVACGEAPNINSSLREDPAFETEQGDDPDAGSLHTGTPAPASPSQPAWSQDVCGSGLYLVTTKSGNCPALGDVSGAHWQGTPLFAGVTSGQCSYEWKVPSAAGLLTSPTWAALESIAMQTPDASSACQGARTPLIFARCSDLADGAGPALATTVTAAARPDEIAQQCLYGEMVGCGSCAVAIDSHVYVVLDPLTAQVGEVAIGLIASESWVYAPHTVGDQVFQIELPAGHSLPEYTPLLVLTR